MIVTDNKFAPITVDQFWNELMSVDDYVELMARTPKEPYPTEHVESIDIRADAFKWGFCPVFNKISTHV